MKMIKWMFIAMAGFLFWQCSKEDNIIAKETSYRRTYDTTSSDPVEKYIAKYFYKFGKVFIVDPDTSDYLYNFQSKNAILIKAPKQETEHLLYGISFMNDLFMKFYSDSFKKEHFPFSLIISDSIATSGYGGKEKDYYMSRNFIALSVGAKTKNYTVEEKRHLSLSMHIDYLANFLYQYDNGFNLDAFFKFGGTMYGTSTGTSASPNKWKIEKVYGVGFLLDYAGWNNTKTDFPSRQVDLSDWLRFIFQCHEDQWSKIPKDVEGTLAKYPVMQAKYNALVAAIKNTLGVDYHDLIYKE